MQFIETPRSNVDVEAFVLNLVLSSSSGPRQAEMSGVNEKIVTVKKLLEGNYVFKLTVTDDKGLTGSDTVAVNVKKGEVQIEASVIYQL